MATLNEIRATFLHYFERNGHEVVKSSPLVPRNDPTLMFTNSGMVQFKGVFTGVERRDYVRAVTSQKCVRAGGKHNDLDNVGYTARHHTFFEMLGNFSFGDYFKEQAIAYCWELMTKELGVPASRLLATVYHDDDEAAGLWRKIAGFSDSRVIRIASSDNFWSMGATGPCGPCTELYYDHGDGVPGGPPGSADEDGDRYTEIWNLVFMQFERFEDGRRDSLPRPSIDTGMGLERIGALLQGQHDNYETDVFQALIAASAEESSTDTGGLSRIHHRVIADHLRSASFLIAEGVLPTNIGRGYVLRRIMRRAMRHAHLLGTTDPMMHLLVPILVQKMGNAFPELATSCELIEETFLNEETRFKQMLARGLTLLEDEVATLPAGDKLSGAVAFKLHDTFGFPLDLTRDALREKGLEVDISAYDAAMQQQRERARKAWSGSGGQAEDALWHQLSEECGATEFLGYETLHAEGVILAIIADGTSVESAIAGREVQIITNQSPFYPEGGGQMGDIGEMVTATATHHVTATDKRAALIVHTVTIGDGSLHKGDAVQLTVTPERREKIRSSHSCTHLLHEALRRRFGKQLAQRGSRNAPEAIRFDFSHSRPLSDEDLTAIEHEVNRLICQDSPVKTRIMATEDATSLGAVALFEEKYGDEVRVVSMGLDEGSGRGSDGNSYSMELCGGTHVERTGRIGLFAVTAESASAAGIRRIEALTGEAARTHLAGRCATLAETASLLKTDPNSVPQRVRELLEERRQLASDVEGLRRSAAQTSAARQRQVISVGSHQLAMLNLSNVVAKDMPMIVDEQKAHITSGVAVVISDCDGKALVAVGVTDDLVESLSAVKIVRAVTPALGGSGGGGRADLARGGGTDPSAAKTAFTIVETMLEDLP